MNGPDLSDVDVNFVVGIQGFLKGGIQKLAEDFGGVKSIKTEDDLARFAQTLE
jgi:hypothetical protein